MDNLISIIVFLPTIAAAILALFLRGDDDAARRNAKWLALIATSATFLISLFLFAGFDPDNTGFQFVEEREWLLGLSYKMGVDGISILFVMLTTFLMPLVIASCWDVTYRVKEYMVAFAESHPDQLPQSMEQVPEVDVDAISEHPNMAGITYSRQQCQRCHVGGNGRDVVLEQPIGKC